MERLPEYAPLLLEGFGITIALAILSMLAATVLGILGAAAKLGGGPISGRLAKGYTTVVRGIPELVLMFLIYFGGQRLLNSIVKLFDGGFIEVPEFAAGVVALGFVYGAYLTETFRGAYLAISTGQSEAARALGMKRWGILFKVMMPQLVRVAMPGYANVWQVLTKGTALVSAIGLHDLVGRARTIGASLREPFTYLFIAAMAYLVITIVSAWVFKRIERRTERWA